MLAVQLRLPRRQGLVFQDIYGCLDAKYNPYHGHGKGPRVRHPDGIMTISWNLTRASRHGFQILTVVQYYFPALDGVPVPHVSNFNNDVHETGLSMHIGMPSVSPWTNANIPKMLADTVWAWSHYLPFPSCVVIQTCYPPRFPLPS